MLNRWCGLAALSALALSGCANELGPEPMPTVRVVGRVHIRGAPVGPGWIEFNPVDGTIGLLRVAQIAADGTFVADRVSLGKNAIQIAPAANLPLAFRDFGRIALVRREVRDTPTTTIDIDLEDELLHLLKEHGRL
ncbi:MAG TPA: hypothetical protein VGY53_03010 [Isosphaeraceae bacterium]|jgi:hypothetical protein|nr:hypothetical protein [Isosphaeraceae bacterium]